MKRFLSFVITPLALVLTSPFTLAARQIDPATGLPEPGPEHDQAVRRNQAEAELQKAEADKAAAEARFQYEKQRTGGGGGGMGGSGGYSPFGATPGFRDRLQSIIHRPGSVTRPVIIRSSPMEPKEEAGLEEDLSVMSHILDKSLNEKVGWQAPATTAMGVNVYFAPGSTPMRTLYLEGYGALFLLNVGFPLVPAATKEAQEKPSGDSTWEEAKQELYGQHSYGRTVGPAEEFSEERVNKLKDALLESLKNAANIRDLKPEDSVTVSVFGGAAAGAAHVHYKAVEHLAAPAKNGGVTVMSAPDGASQRKTVLTIRVRKADADAFSKGKMNLDDFRKKARITAYAGNAEDEGLAIGSVGIWNDTGWGAMDPATGLPGTGGGGFGGGLGGGTRH
jgi:hypothetical protein